MDVQYLSLIANLGALAVAGILYAAYINNLRSQVSLKQDQINTAEQQAKLWKDKALELERHSPQFVEQVLAQRIKIREEEIARLKGDGEAHVSEVERKNAELLQLAKELDAARIFGRGISIYDRDTHDLRQLAPGDLTLVDLGEVWVDSATLMIVDPWHFSMSREREIEEFPVYKWMYRVRATGEVIYVAHENEQVELRDLEGVFTASELVAKGELEALTPPSDLPVFPETYIKGDNLTVGTPGKTKAGTFYNGTAGAGLSVGLGADGAYRIRAESYNGKIVRVFFDLLL